MGSLAAFLLEIAWPVVSKVLLSLGIGYATYTGLDAALTGALNAAKSAMGGLPADVALLVARFGFFEYMSITAGAVVSGAAWTQVSKLVAKKP